MPELRDARCPLAHPLATLCRARPKEASAPPRGTGSALGTLFRPGETIEGLRILKLLGEGRFGQVFLAQSSTHGIHAVKTIRNELHDRLVGSSARKRSSGSISDPTPPHAGEVRRRSEREALLRHGVRPPERQGLNDLEGYLKRQPPDLGRSLGWAIEFCHGMEFAQGNGVRCHRDVKPPNVLIGSEGRVRITDFGIAGVIVARAASSGCRKPTQLEAGFSPVAT